MHEGVSRRLAGIFASVGRASWIVCDERSGDTVSEARADEPFDSASLIKLAILAVLLHQAPRRGALDARIRIETSDLAHGDGILRDLSLPLRLSRLDTAMLMITLSDNTATNALLRILGPESINDQLEAWAFATTRTHGFVPAPGEPRRSIGVTSAREVRRLLDHLRTGGSRADPDGRWAMHMLERQQDDRALSRYLSPGTRCAHKTGTAGAARHDGGVILDSTGKPLLTAVFLTADFGPPVERHDHPGVLAIALATASVVRALELPVRLVPWTPG